MAGVLLLQLGSDRPPSAQLHSPFSAASVTPMVRLCPSWRGYRPSLSAAPALPHGGVTAPQPGSGGPPSRRDCRPSARPLLSLMEVLPPLSLHGGTAAPQRGPCPPSWRCYRPSAFMDGLPPLSAALALLHGGVTAPQPSRRDCRPSARPLPSLMEVLPPLSLAAVGRLHGGTAAPQRGPCPPSWRGHRHRPLLAPHAAVSATTAPRTSLQEQLPLPFFPSPAGSPFVKPNTLSWLGRTRQDHGSSSWPCRDTTKSHSLHPWERCSNAPGALAALGRARSLQGEERFADNPSVLLVPDSQGPEDTISDLLSTHSLC
ncbi:uncharacterized protein [Taeniopygia guttata]|uniref:uncharacterized protein isoform X1 n=1 Tax=Taeniopygia guttata TaxID=59729 RepID=UPI003BB911D8